MAYVPKGVFYDGTTDVMSRSALTGIANGKEGLFSAWFRVDGKDGQLRRLFNGDSGAETTFVEVLLINTNQIRIRFRAVGGTTIATLLSTGTFTSSSSAYFHLLSSWDLATSTLQLYIDDVSDLDGASGSTNVDIPYTSATVWRVGAGVSDFAKFSGGLSDVYFATEFLDLSIVSNRRKFIDASGNPVFLGTTGQLPTSTSSIVYIRGEQADQGLNAGTGGDFVSQATQVPLETPGPIPDATGSLTGAGNMEAAGPENSATLQGVGGFQSAGTLLPFPVATLPGVGGFQSEGLSQGEIRSTQQGVGGFQAIATFIGAVSDATLPGVGGMSVRAVNLDFGIPNEEALVCDPALDSSSPGSGALPRSWNGL